MPTKPKPAAHWWQFNRKSDCVTAVIGCMGVIFGMQTGYLWSNQSILACQRVETQEVICQLSEWSLFGTQTTLLPAGQL
jgi:hypothetical protein